MRGRTATCVLAAAVVTALGAAPAAAQESAARDVPPEMWQGLPPQDVSAPDDDGGLPATTLLAALALGAAAIAGFLLTGVRRPAAAPAPPPEPTPPTPTPRSRAPRFQGCAITLSRSSSTSEFRVVVGKGAERRVVGRSRRFPAPRSGPLPDEGPARAAFDELVGRLEAVGWRAVAAESDVWHKVQLLRPRVGGSASPHEQAVIDAHGDGFAAFGCDDYGNRLRLAERAVHIDEAPEDAHAELVAQLEADGWQVAGSGDPWFATTLTRRALTLVP